MMSSLLDSTDGKILYEIDLNARASAAFIAKKIRKPKETVHYRLNKYLKEKKIRYFYTLVNASMIGYHYYLILIKLNRAGPKEKKGIANHIIDSGSCISINEVEGRYDFSLVAAFIDPERFNSFMKRLYSKCGNRISEKSINLVLATHKFSQGFLSDAKIRKVSSNHSSISDISLKNTDREIIGWLSDNARMKLNDLAAKIKVNEKLIKYHLKQLERKNIIVGYFPMLNMDALDRELLQVNICLKNPQVRPGIIEYFSQSRTCNIAYELLGKYDLVLEFSVEDHQQLRKLISGFRHHFDYIEYNTMQVYRNNFINWSP